MRDRAHAGATRALDAERRILEHEALRRRRVDARRGQEKEVGLGLAARDVVRADRRVEEIPHPEAAERERDVVRVAGGGAGELHAGRLGRAAQNAAKPAISRNSAANSSR